MRMNRYRCSRWISFKTEEDCISYAPCLVKLLILTSISFISKERFIITVAYFTENSAVQKNISCEAEMEFLLIYFQLCALVINDSHDFFHMFLWIEFSVYMYLGPDDLYWVAMCYSH